MVNKKRSLQQETTGYSRNQWRIILNLVQKVCISKSNEEIQMNHFNLAVIFETKQEG